MSGYAKESPGSKEKAETKEKKMGAIQRIKKGFSEI